MNKTEYTLRSFRKIQHKPWELFIISGIIHGIKDTEIQFITQQYVRRPNGSYALTDLFFPQFSLHLEIDESHHCHSENKIVDDVRERDIIDITNHSIFRIKTYHEVADGQCIEKSLEHILDDIHNFVKIIISKKSEMINSGSFAPWDIDNMYAPMTFIRKGYIDVADNVAFRYQVDALQCFGFNGLGWQRGEWNIPDGTNDSVWFPRLYRHGEWTNTKSRSV
jgi:hypothetical protein